VCGTRENSGGVLKALTHGRLITGNADPIEKKPLFHFHPGSRTFSVAAMGCNLSCPFCQNHTLSARPKTVDHGEFVPPSTIVEAALASGCSSIAFTYSEPILLFEYAEKTAPLAANRHLNLAFATNGQATKSAAKRLGAILQAANVDLKCFSETKYRNVLGGYLSATLSTIERWMASDVWVEVTTLVIPEFNDGDEELTAIARFLSRIDPAIPWHVTRFHPAHKWRRGSPTGTETLTRAREIGLAEGLKFVYTGNIPGDDGEKTRCPKCNTVVIDRVGYRITGVALSAAQCIKCGETIAGRGLP
jgi:pyruvate formate lyase activating enzyme